MIELQSVKNGSNHLNGKGDNNHAESTTGFITGIREKPTLYQHSRHHASYERDVPRRHSAGDGSGDGGGTRS